MRRLGLLLALPAAVLALASSTSALATGASGTTGTTGSTGATTPPVVKPHVVACPAGVAALPPSAQWVWSAYGKPASSAGGVSYSQSGGNGSWAGGQAHGTVCSENHGGEKRLLRVRCAMRSSSLARVLLRCYAALGAGSLILGEPGVAVFFLTLGIFNLAVVGWQLLTFGRLMHRIVEAVASQARLMPAEPIGATALSIGEPRTV